VIGRVCSTGEGWSFEGSVEQPVSKAVAMTKQALNRYIKEIIAQAGDGATTPKKSKLGHYQALPLVDWDDLKWV
jgi:hypothetical protein